MADSNIFMFTSLVVHNKLATLDSHPIVKDWYELCAAQRGPKKTLEAADAFWASMASK